MDKNICVIGGGFFGLYLAGVLANSRCKVTVYESKSSLGTEASLLNQARIHRGYHYPRSFLTAVRSAELSRRFEEDFSNAVYRTRHRYGISRLSSRVSAGAFEAFCKRLDVKCQPVSFNGLLNNVEAVFEVDENAFNARNLMGELFKRLGKKNVDIVPSTRVKSVAEAPLRQVEVKLETGSSVRFDEVFNCTYSHLNHVNVNSGLPILPMKHQVAEICLIEEPKNLEAAFTLMDGGFFSIMPYPAADTWSLTHVRYTHHETMLHRVTDKELNEFPLDGEGKEPKSRYEYMRRDVLRYLPDVQLKHIRSKFVTKSTLVGMESSDSRPIQFAKNHGLNGYHCVLGAKIDNVYDLEDVL